MAETKSYFTYLVVILIRLIYCGMYLLTKISFNVGMSTFIFVFYRQLTASIFLAPIAIFCEWKRHPLSFIIFVKLFLLALVGITICLDVHGVAVKYTGPTLAAATTNSIPVITLFLALIFRLKS
ncbi:hypothetical protein Leryth_003510 [Lithospermum erythrorhizon]|nr:hypothetical protein Leryth_003510 [Lithospermum erythrorhizon]